MGAVVIGIAAVLLIASAFLGGRSRAKPGGPVMPGSGEIKLTCPICGRTFVQAGGTYLQEHPPCPWPRTPLIPKPPKRDEIDVVPPGPTPIDPIVPDKPDEPVGPDPYKPTLNPTPGAYYQAKKGDVGCTLAHKAYPEYKALPSWGRVVAHGWNAWIAYNKAVGWKGDIIQHYSGWNTAFDSGNRYPVIYFPTLEEMGA